MEHIFIINPAAGKTDRSEQLRGIIRSCCEGRGLSFRIEISQAPGDCTRLARAAAAAGNEVRLYACGGDGTLNEVIAGAAEYENAAVTHYAGGSGNDFVKNFSEPAAFRDLERLLDAEETRFDLMECNGEYAINICSVGLDARIGRDVQQYKRLPLVTGSGAYILSTAVNVCRGIGEHYRVELEGRSIDGSFTMICAANGRWYGGGFHPVPDADPADGWLDVLLVQKVRALQVPLVVGKYKQGRYRELPHLVEHVRTKALTIHCDRSTPVNMDGEIRTARRIELKLTGKTVRFFYPKGLSWK